MAIIGLVGAGMEAVDGMHAGKSQGLVACRYSWKCLSTGSYGKAPVRSPCSQLAAIHGAPRIHL